MSLDVGQIEGGLKLDVTQYERPFDRMIDKTRRGSATLSAELLDASKAASASLAKIESQSSATGQSIAKLAAESGMMSAASQRAAASLDRVERSAANTAAGVGQLDRRLVDVDARLGRVANAANRAANASIGGFTDLRILLSAVDENMQRLTQHTLQQASAAAKIVPSRTPPGSGGSSGANRALAIAGAIGAVNPRVGQFVSGITAVKSVSDEMGISFGKSAAIVGAAVVPIFAATKAFGFLKEGIDQAADMEQTRISFETIIGDADQAHRTLDDLKRFADATPFQFPEIAAAGKQLLAMGIPAKDLVATLRRLGDVSSGLGQPLGEMAYLLGQVKSQGRALTQDLNQFAGRGVPIYAELAKVLKTSEAGVREFAEAGKIGYREIEAAIVAMTSAGGKFHDMTLRQSRSLKGELSTLEDAWNNVKRAAGEAFLTGGTGNKGVEDLTDRVNKLEPAAERFGAALSQVLEAALPVAESIADVLTDAVNYFTDASAKLDMQVSKGRAVVGGVDRLGAADVSRMTSIVANLTTARQRLGGGLQGLQGSGAERDLPSSVRTTIEQAAKLASESGATTAAAEAVRLLRDKASRGESISAADMAQARRAIQSLGGEVDRFRDTLVASKNQLAMQSSRYTYATGWYQAATTGHLTSSTVDAAAKSVDDALRNAGQFTSPVWKDLHDERERPATKPKPMPATPATQPAPAGDVDATPKERRAADVAAKRDAKDASKSAANAADAAMATRVAELESIGQRMEADVARVAARHADALRDAKTPTEEAAIAKQVLAEQDVVRRKYADAAVKVAQRQNATIRRGDVALARQVDADLKAHDREARRVADAIADYQLEAQVTILRAFGRDFDATMLEAEHRYAERVRHAESEEEKLTAKVALESAKREAQRKHREDVQSRTGVSLPTTPIANATQRQRTAKTPAERALAQLDLREAKGITLTPEEEARRDRLRKRTSTGADGLPSDADPSSEAAARERMKRAKTPAERALAALEIRQAKGEKLSPADVARRDRLRDQLGIDPADRQSPAAAAAAAAVVPQAAPKPAAATQPIGDRQKLADVNARRIAEQNMLASRYKPLFDTAASPAQQAAVGRGYEEASAAIDRRYAGRPDPAAMAAAAAATATPSIPRDNRAAAQAAGSVAGIDAARSGATTRPTSGGSPSFTVNSPTFNVGELAAAVASEVQPKIDRAIRNLKAEMSNKNEARRVGRSL